MRPVVKARRRKLSNRRKTTKKLHQLFDQQRFRLEIDGEPEEVVVCPLTLEIFNRADIEPKADNERRVSIEHAPQKASAVAAVERCITATACNTSLAFEARAGQRRKLRESTTFGLPGAPSAMVSETEFGLQTVSFQAPHFHGREKHGLVIPTLSWPNIGAISLDERLVELKTGYLIAFVTYGYAFAMNVALNVVREAILMNRGVHPCAMIGVNDSDDGDIFDHDTDVTTVEIGGLPAIAVRLAPTHPIKRGQDPSRHVVLLPTPTSPTNFYDLLPMALEAHGIIEDVRESRRTPDEHEMPRVWDRCNDPSHNHPSRTSSMYLCASECEKHNGHRWIELVEPDSDGSGESDDDAYD